MIAEFAARLFRFNRLSKFATDPYIARLAKSLNFWAARTFRYTSIGTICAILNNIIIISGDFFEVSYYPMTIVAFASVTPIAYLLHANFTFQQPGSWRSFWPFAAGLATALPLFFLIMEILCRVFNLSVILASPGATIILYIWNYMTSHWAFCVWRKARRSKWN